nr:hypothetical protein [Flavobacterium sp.]
MNLQVNKLPHILFFITCVLLVPFIMMQFSSQVKWTLFDFFAAFILLFITGISVELVRLNIKNVRLKIILLIAICALLLTIWAELAVDIF